MQQSLFILIQNFIFYNFIFYYIQTSKNLLEYCQYQTKIEGVEL